MIAADGMIHSRRLSHAELRTLRRRLVECVFVFGIVACYGGGAEPTVPKTPTAMLVSMIA